MARLDIGDEHGRGPGAARQDFEKAIAAARSAYAHAIREWEWS
jgi:hypothetical protein